MYILCFTNISESKGLCKSILNCGQFYTIRNVDDQIGVVLEIRLWGLNAGTTSTQRLIPHPVTWYGLDEDIARGS